MGRTPCCSSPGQKKGPWTPEEDHLLTKYIETHGEGQWRTLPKKAGLKRCGKGCRLRWMNYLRPNVKRGNISTEEEELIVRLHKLLGNRWSLIAGRVPGRTDNEIKNYWNTHLSKKIRCNDIAPTINSKSSTHFLSNVGDIKVFQRNGDLETNALFNVPFAFDQMNTMNQKQHCPPALHLNTSNALNGNSLVYDEHEVQYYSCGAGDLLNSDIFHESCILLNPMDVMSQINKPHQADIRVGETHNITDSQQCYLDSSPSYYTDPQHCHTITHDPAWTLFLGDLASSQQPPTITASGSNESSFDLKQQYLSSSIHGTDRCSHAVEETDSILREFHSQDLGYTADQFLYRINDESIICNAGNSLLGCSDDILNSYRNALCGESQAQQNAVEMQSLELILGNCFGQFLNSMYS